MVFITSTTSSILLSYLLSLTSPLSSMTTTTTTTIIIIYRGFHVRSSCRTQLLFCNLIPETDVNVYFVLVCCLWGNHRVSCCPHVTPMSSQDDAGSSVPKCQRNTSVQSVCVHHLTFLMQLHSYKPESFNNVTGSAFSNRR